ncbi:MAG TPA: metallophosphoesterase [Bacteroidales bacterium]|nr:metallophosphoesterase [Bacteroidales bacterium]
MNLLIRIVVISLVIIVSDIYFYRLIKNLFIKNGKGRRLLKAIIFIQAIAFIIFEACCILVIGYPLDDYVKYRQLFILLNAFILMYLPKSVTAVFLIFHDIFRIIPIIFRHKNGKEKKRSKICYVAALFVFLAVLAICIQGFTCGKTNVTIRKIDLSFSRLPGSFENFRIVQISDLHLGSFKDLKPFIQYMKLIGQLSPDILVSTGDMINVSDRELDPFDSLFRKIKPPYGKYSILGNHDIGDYFQMKRPENTEEITQKLIQRQTDMGFLVLIDSACYIKKDNDSLALIGVNNWGTFPFKKNGNLNKATAGTADNDFKILLSHDSNHWLYEVSGKTNIELTLSGHTHGMQLGFITNFIKFSPSRLIYKFWQGLYGSGEQKLYVNPGLGYSGFSARIGIRPEITLIILHRKSSP